LNEALRQTDLQAGTLNGWNAVFGLSFTPNPSERAQFERTECRAL
jgi:hypothetical protein